MHDTSHTSVDTTTSSGTVAVAVPRTDVPTGLDDQLRMAEALASATTMVPPQYRGAPGNVLAAMLYARTLDIPLTMAMQDLFISPTGQVGMTAALVHGLILRAGHRIHVLNRDAQGCVLRLERCDDDREMIAGFTWDDAFTANLLKKDNWEKYPEDMFFARALTRLARRFAIRETKGFAYTPEELDDDEVEPRLSDGEAPRAIAERVATIVARADEATDVADILDIARAAERDRLFTQFTARGERLRDHLLRVYNRLNSPAADEAEQTPQTTDDDDDVDTAAKLVADERLRCGCLKAGFIAGGGHRTGCTARPADAADVVS